MNRMSLALLFTATTTAAAQNYEITSYTIDGGGSLNLSGGAFTLSGTVGQPDAVSPLLGGSVEVLGGFWPGVFGSQPCLADVAAPFGTLNFFDVAAYIGLYNTSDPTADLVAPFGSLNFFDVAGFIGIYNSGCP